MANALFNPGREGLLDGTINWSTGDQRVMLVRNTYVFSALHKFVSDLGVVDNGRSAALATKTVADGIADAADTSLVATAAVACNALAIFQHTGVDTTARLVAYIDGRARVEMAAAAALNATSLVTEDLLADIANGGVLTLISGTGPATITTSAAAVTGARALTVTAIGSAIVAGAVYEYQANNTGVFTPSVGQTVNVVWDNGANKIFKL